MRRRYRRYAASGTARARASACVELDAITAADAEWCERVVVLQAAELALDGGTPCVQGAEPFGVPGDERVPTISLDRPRAGVTLARGATPFGGAPLEVGTRKRPLAMLTRERRRFHFVCEAAGGDGGDSALHAGLVEGAVRRIAPVIPLRKGRVQPDTPIKRGTDAWGALHREPNRHSAIAMKHPPPADEWEGVLAAPGVAEGALMLGYVCPAGGYRSRCVGLRRVRCEPGG